MDVKKATFVLIPFLGLAHAEIKPALYDDGKYHNRIKINEFSFGKSMSILGRMAFHSFPWQEPDSTIQSRPLQAHQILGPKDSLRFWKLGHSTVLFQFKEKLIITDPIFSDRASPVSFAGPKRFSSLPISLKELPPVDWVLISHDHYDHLDEESIEQLEEGKPRYLVPMGVAEILEDFGVAKERIFSVNWGDSLELEDLKFYAVPSQHFSGRSLFNRMETLWSAYVIRFGETQVYFSGDTGYNKGFKEANAQFGPMDLAFLELGAYNEDWAQVHMFPQEAVQAALDLEAKWMVPIHNGTFDLAFHPWFEPMEAVIPFAEEKKVNLLQPEFGEEVPFPIHFTNSYWWRKYMPVEALKKN